MQKVWKTVRAIVTVLLLLVVGIPTLAYVLLSFDSVQDDIRGVSERELSHVLGARVSIGRLGVRPFNRIWLGEVAIVDSAGTDTMARIRRVSGGIKLWNFIRSGEIVVDYAMVDGVDVHIWRRDSAAPLNIQPVLDHLRSDRPRQRETPFELSINTVVVRRATIAYDILSAPTPEEGRFDPRHILVSDLAVNAYIPKIANHEYSVDLVHLSACERSGFELRRLSAKASIADSTATVSGLIVETPDSRLTFEPLGLTLGGDIRQSLAQAPLEVKTGDGCRLYPPDFAPFVPALGQIRAHLDFDLDLSADASEVELRRLMLRKSGSDSFGFAASATITGLDSLPGLRYRTERTTAIFTGSELASTLSGLIPLRQRLMLRSLPLTAFTISAEGGLRQGSASLRSDGDAGLIDAEASYLRRGRNTEISGELTLRDFNAGLVAGVADVGDVSGTIGGTVSLGRKIIANADADISSIALKDHAYSNLHASLEMPEADRAEITVTLDDPAANANIYAFYNALGSEPELSATASLANVDLDALGLPDPKPGYTCGAKMIAQVKGRSLDGLEGSVDLTDIRWLDEHNRGLRLPRLTLTADPQASVPTLTLTSDIISGSIRGPYSLKALPGQLKCMLAEYVDVLFPGCGPESYPGGTNRFSYEFQINSTESIGKFFGLPVAVVYPATLSGYVDSDAGVAVADLDAPYILQGDKIYDGTTLFARLDRPNDESMVYLTTQFPTKKGDMALAGIVKANDNRIDTHVDWTIQRRIPLNGAIDFSTLLTGLSRTEGRKPLSPVEATVNFNPGTINFGYETWHIPVSSIELGAESITLNDFALHAGDQHIRIDGTVSYDPADTLTVSLADVQLLPIFETLEIDKAMLSGSATANFKATDLLGDGRNFESTDMHVDSIGYNRCTIGDADILARWDREKQSFFLDADITGDNGKKSRITGDIMPMAEALDLDFYADSVPVAFLKPFMEAFARDISGRASGHCRLFGTFKEIDLTGDVYGENIRMAVDFTNTVYSYSDSVHMRPGQILIPSATIYDSEGHRAKLNGWVRHTFFKAPVYDFNVTEARDFLSYNGTPAQNPDWYGTIYGNGSARVYGEPGQVNIEANMNTAPRSSFTFVISDRLDAIDYSFINFRDMTPDSLRTAQRIVDDVPEIVREIQARINRREVDEPSDYRMKLVVGITPDAALTLVMDPATNDEIKATGSGHMTMTYNSTDEDLRLIGEYTVETGSYHFTLQDIIIKDFTIKPGSTIRFDGDPYAVQANLKAYYATNANLTDLDESFLMDRDVARTNVPVHALMLVEGDIRQPDINFDLEFPTLTSDTYRKVRSIVSTKDMMNRQIIYLLALNRFYTPDYMSSTTKGSELFSVASSTIGSQLSTLLGKLSDNWSIAPNVRSDRGDFSDVEVDVALSSRLLNNRLLFNGNFGYRDKSLNSNQFVGDFDIEYLLGRRGIWRLKAYNRYNDANYYLRSAATTQGIGIMYRRDFDNIFSFLHPKKKKNRAAAESAPDTPTPQPEAATDSVRNE